MACLRWKPVTWHQLNQNKMLPVRGKRFAQILVNLKQLGLVDSSRGQKGGYVLARAPQKIRLSEILQHFENTKFFNHHRFKKKTTGSFNVILQEVEDETWKRLEQITFEEIIKRERNLNKVPMFAI